MSKNAKRAISVLLAMLLIFGLVGCSSKEPEAPPSNESEQKETAYKDCLVIGDSETLSNLDPQANNSTYNRRIYEMTHNTLVRYDFTTGEYTPNLAESYEISEDGLQYTFHLHQGVKFHNGDDCTAEDVVYTFERAMESSTLANGIVGLEKVEAIDDYTVIMTLSAVNVEFIIGISSNGFVILDKDAISADPERGAMVGTGPYVMTEWAPDDYVLLTRNEGYFGELPKSKQIKYRMISETSARVIALQTGEIDICMEVPAIEAPHVADAEGCELIELPSSKLAYVALNVSGANEALMDIRVRQALQHATDTATIITAMTEGYGQPANGFIPPAVWGYCADLKGYDYDVEKAKQLLADAGYADGLNLSLLYKKASFPGMFELLEAQWSKVGVTLTIDTDDSSLVSDKLREKKYDMYMSQFLTTSPGEINQMWLGSSSSNRTLINDETLNTMLTDALTISDSDERLAKYAEIGQYINDTAAMIPLYIETMLFGVRDNVEGAKLLGNGRHELTYAYATVE